MAVKFFGQYLLEKNIIKSIELVKAADFQASKNMDFGECALAKGYISGEDLANLKNGQKQVDMKFGEVAIKLNILTPEQVDDVLAMQKENNIFLGDALVATGCLAPDVMEKELELFREDQKKHITGDIKIPEGVRNPGEVKIIVDMTQKMFQRIARLQVKVDDGFISDKEPSENFLLVSIPIHGGIKCDYILSLPQDVSVQIASAIMDEDVIAEAIDLVIDGVKEFCNIVCGNIISKFSINGTDVDIAPPIEQMPSDNGYRLLKGSKAIYYPLVSCKGNFTLILIEN